MGAGEFSDRGLAEWALWNAAQGFRVFPLKPGAKEPAHKGWQAEATRDPETIRRIWNGTDYNIGIATGDGLAVVDVDVKNGKQGVASFRALGLSGDNTFVVETVSGGFHVYYAAPDLPNSVERVAAGLDVRSKGGFVVGVGSRIDGREYVARRVNPRETIPPVFVQLAGKPAERQHTADPVSRLDTDANLARALHYLENEAPIAVEGSHGDDTTYKVAAAVRDFGLSEPACFAMMADHWNARCQPPWPPQDLETKVANAYDFAQNPPGIYSPENDFRGVRVEPPATPVSEWWFPDQAAPDETRWLFHNLLGAEGVCLLVGESVSGKTFFVTEMARCLFTGKPFFGTAPDDRGCTLFVFAGSEGSGFENRVKALGEPVGVGKITTWNLRQPGQFQALVDNLARGKAAAEARFGVPLRLIVLETLSTSGFMDRENDNAQAAAAMAALARIGELLGCLVIVTHHPSKGGAQERGAGALRGSADFILSITREGLSAVRDVELTKGRNVPERRIGAFSLVEVELSKDSRGRPVISMALSMGEPQTKTQKKIRNLERLVAAWDMIEPEDVFDMDGQRWVYEDAWRAAFVALDNTPDRSNRIRKFRAALTGASEQGIVIRAMGPEGVCLRLVAVEARDG